MKGSSSYSYSKIPSHDLSGLSGFSVDKPVISSPGPSVDLSLVALTIYNEFSKYLTSYLAKGLFFLIFIYVISFFEFRTVGASLDRTGEALEAFFPAVSRTVYRRLR
jgi:hypothetical protein